MSVDYTGLSAETFGGHSHTLGYYWDVATLTAKVNTSSGVGPPSIVDQGAAGASAWLMAFSAPQHVIVDTGGGGTAHAEGDPNDATNLFVLPALAMEAGPSYSDGQKVSLSVDLAGYLRNKAIMQDGGGNGLVTATADPASNTRGLVVRAIPSATATPVSGTVTANAGSGTFAVSAAALPLPTGAATAVRQDTSNTWLGSIETDLQAQLVDLDSINTRVATLISSAAGGYVRQDTNATIAKETGGNLANILARQADGTQRTIIDSITGTASAANTSTALLAANAAFTGTFEDVKNYAGIVLSIYADVASVVNGLEFQWSSDGVNVDRSEKSSLLAATGRAFNLSTRSRYFRVKVTNGPDPQTAFRLNTFYLPAASGVITKPLKGTVTDDNFAQSTQAALMGRLSTGTFIALAADKNGKLSVMNTDTAILQTLVDVMTDLRTELRVLNSVVAQGLNVKDDLDNMRQDPYFAPRESYYDMN